MILVIRTKRGRERLAMHTHRPDARQRPDCTARLCSCLIIWGLVLGGCANRDLVVRPTTEPVPLTHRQIFEQPSRAGSGQNQDIQLAAGWTDVEKQTQPHTSPAATEDQPAEPAELDDVDSDVERLPPPADDATAQPNTGGGDELTLEQVLMSIAESFPPLEVALAELAAAEGKALSKWGGFDTKLRAHSISAPLGFYQTYRNGFGAKQPLWKGGEVYGGYRIGRGNFQPWFGERQTNDGGELKTGIRQPIFQNYAIDERRAELEIAQLERLRLEPDIQTRILEIQRMASRMYWDWVAAGRVLEVNRRLLELAEDRSENIEVRVDEGDLPRLALVDNGRFIAKRQTTLVKARRGLEKVAIKLALFYRDESGAPIVVAAEHLPEGFPEATRTEPAAVEEDIAKALAARPELLELEYQRQQVSVELCRAKNETLPRVDAFAEAGQDVGGASSSKRDKSPFELELGVLAEVPLQRRKAIGRVQAAEAKLGQIAAKRQFAEDKIRTQVQNAVSALHRAYQSIERAKENFELSQESVRLGQASFDEGDTDIIELNIRETALAEAALLLIDANFTYFAAVADYRAALGIVDLP